MTHPLSARRFGDFSRGATVLATLLVVGPAIGGPPAGDLARAHELVGPRGEIGLPAPVRYAILGQAPGEIRRLLARGDVLFHPQDPARSWTVERVEAKTVVLREGPRGRRLAIRSGTPIPGFPGFTFIDTVLLDQLQYRYRVVDRLRHLDPVLISLQGTRAVLEVETLHSEAPAGGSPFEGAAPPASEPARPGRVTLDGDLLEKVRVREAGPGLYDVPAGDVQAVLDNAGDVLADLWPSVQPSLSLKTGLEYRITSAVGDGVLTGQGFTVTAPKLAERAGIQVGDTILRVNGQPVDGFASLYGIFQAVRQVPALRTVQVELARGGARLTKTYRIR